MWFFVVVIGIVVIILAGLGITLCLNREPEIHYGSSRSVVPVKSFVGYQQKKSDIIIRELIEIKTKLPPSGHGSGVRTVAAIFNRRHASDAIPCSVSKSTVAKYLRLHRYEVIQLRRELKHRVPRSMPRNRIWGLDLTGRQTADKSVNTISGLIDHGSRACLSLSVVPNKSAITLLKLLLASVEQFGKPKVIRTDNEPVFKSRVFRMGLWLLGIRHQTTELYCPWQNGRVERLFGTLKDRLRPITFADSLALQQALIEFRLWYNHVRPHQHLEDRTPAEVWNGTTSLSGKRYDFSAWYGLLIGDVYLE